MQTFAVVKLHISCYAPVVPLFKGVVTNPLIRIRIYIPAGGKHLELKNVSCILNLDGLKAIDQIFAYDNGDEPMFSTKFNSISLTPIQTAFKIPLAINLEPGIHYIWLAVSLKHDANIDSKVLFQMKNLGDGAALSQQIIYGGSVVKRVGLVLKKAGEGGVNTFRIPGITTTNNGTLLSVYDVRYETSGDLPGNIDVGMSKSSDGGRTWQPMKIIMDMGTPQENNGVGDPAILFDPLTNKIWVAALWSKGNRSIAGSKPGLSADVTGQLVLVSSADDGETWTKPRSITAEVKNPNWNIFFNGPGAGIAMKDGKLVFAAQYWDENAIPHSTILYSADHGASWKTENGPKSNTTESQVIETISGTLMLNMRDNRGSFRSVATTDDMGKTWIEHHTSYSALQDPVCMASFISAKVKVKGKEKEVVFFGNDNSSLARINLSIKASTDSGETWVKENQVLIDNRNLFGYSALTKIDENTLGFVYEGLGDLYFVRIPVADMIKKIAK
ncbi:exo-alpha-sialidase [Pedobacter sp. UYEF25]